MKYKTQLIQTAWLEQTNQGTISTNTKNMCPDQLGVKYLITESTGDVYHTSIFPTHNKWCILSSLSRDYTYSTKPVSIASLFGVGGDMSGTPRP